ncbi:hypothetical protein [Vibrio gazogenes]|uniref:Uncharacterized protein n=1 Tax=Vibrio gazogenes TaxID=687 RepID=A0A1Z2SL35_VIBGA|nr:hypothetical protein [Vibrio gazogenes]ASA57894.1 hypothetical protein BSQ33_19470 [Vibrio gazogenes]
MTALVKTANGQSAKGAYAAGKVLINDATHYHLEDIANTIGHETQHYLDDAQSTGTHNDAYEANREKASIICRGNSGGSVAGASSTESGPLLLEYKPGVADKSKLPVVTAEIPSVNRGSLVSAGSSSLVAEGEGTGRPIYEYQFNGQTHRTAITVGNNGFIVGANPQ